jgi:hypothetical protein
MQQSYLTLGPSVAMSKEKIDRFFGAEVGRTIDLHPP